MATGDRIWQARRAAMTGLAALALVAAAALAPGVAQAAFPGDNGLIAFSGSHVGAGPDAAEGIFTIRPDGAGLQQLTDDSGSGLDRDREPAWSADGRRLVFTRLFSDSEADKYALFTIDADGGDRTRVVRIGKSLASPAPAFSPSGRRIVYTVIRPRNRRHPTRGSIRTIRRDGTKPRRLKRGYLTDPQYSPSDKRIAFAGTPKGKNRSGIWTMRRDGSRLRRLTDPSRRDRDLSDLAPDYSPDGRHIAFLRDEWLTDGELRVMRANGSRQRVIPAGPGYDPRFPEASSPAFSPAGDRIALPRVTYTGLDRAACSDIYTISRGGSERQNVTNDCDPALHPFGGGKALFPSWQPVR